MQKVRYGIIGANANRMAGEHIKKIKEIDNAEIAALSSTRGDHLKGAHELCPQAKTYQDYKDLLQQDLDCVLVATPNYTHRQIVVDAFSAGKHVLCEKPMATTLEDCDAMIEAAKRNNLKLQVGFHFRYNKLFIDLKKLIDQGELGQLVTMWSQEFRGDWAKDCYINHPKYGYVNWRYIEELSGGSLLEKNCHDFDVFNWMAGCLPKKVSGFGGTTAYHDRETLDHANVIIEYENGIKVSLELALFVPHGFKGRYMGIAGTKSSVKIKGQNAMGQFFRDREDEINYNYQSSLGHGLGVKQQNIEFIDCIINDKQPFANGQVGRDAVELSLAAQQAIKKGIVIEL